MGETTAIAYAHSTFNGWIGCSHVEGNPQCGKCYAERMAKMRGWAKWGDEHPRMLTSVDYWKQPFKWDREAAAAGEQRRVFAFSLGDVFDEFAPQWPEDRDAPGPGPEPLIHMNATYVFLDAVVRRTPHLTWMLFTKRYARAAQFLDALWGPNPWPNVWVMFSAGTQENLDEAKMAHGAFKAVVHGVSCEPTFEALDWGDFGRINWVIGGTESGGGARHTDRLEWFESTSDQCKLWGVPFYMKQITNKGGKQIDYDEWPTSLQVRSFPIA